MRCKGYIYGIRIFPNREQFSCDYFESGHLPSYPLLVYGLSIRDAYLGDLALAGAGFYETGLGSTRTSNLLAVLVPVPSITPEVVLPVWSLNDVLA